MKPAPPTDGQSQMTLKSIDAEFHVDLSAKCNVAAGEQVVTEVTNVDEGLLSANPDLRRVDSLGHDPAVDVAAIRNSCETAVGLAIGAEDRLAQREGPPISAAAGVAFAADVTMVNLPSQGAVVVTAEIGSAAQNLNESTPPQQSCAQ